MAARARGTALEERVRAIAARFADEMVQAVREGLAEEMSLVVRRATRGPDRLGLGGGPGDKRIGKAPVPVKCPVAGCAGAGVRAKRNFCAEHATGLSDGEKRALRGAPKRSRRKRA